MSLSFQKAPISLRATCSLLLLLILLYSCQREITGEVIIPGGSGGGNTPPATVITTIKLLVLDENGNIVTNAKVQSGTTTVYTDQFGIAELKDIRVTANKALVKVNVAGYFEAYRTFSADSHVCFGKIKLTKLGLANVMMSDAGGDILVTNECTIQFPANAFVVKSDNSPYTGAVVVYAQYLQPENNDFEILMPGDLVAEDNGDQLLKSFGMVNVEILGTGNVPLQLKSGVKATLKATIPTSLAADAPATIPMWYFDTNKGVWIKEGNATKQGNQYSGQVSHFTWWNYDWAYPRVFISGIVKDVNGRPIVNSMVKMSVTQFRVTITTYTNEEGYFRVPAPLNAAVSLSMTGTGCNIPFFTTTVTTNSSDINLGTITVPVLTVSNYQVSGNFNNCNNAPIPSGRLRIFTFNNMFESIITNGQSGLTFTFCSDSLDALVLVEDFSTGKIFTQSKRMYHNVPVNLGTLTVCTSMSTKYIRYIVDNQFYYITGNNVDSLTSHYFGFGVPWVQVAHNNYAFPPQLPSDIYFNAEIGGYVSTMMIKAYPNLSNMGYDRELSNRFENYSNVPGAINKGTLTGRQFDTGVNRWRFISVAYSVGQQ
ncbi:MAG TPA: carboxypeptidase-like regulatory domain-containing protein [Chitinophagaceae bacterium]|nr:carboxypeptidase-like regulatory domain-containing protein [Chitinophagaceae bacterium]